jgi:HlyD family secretion protein
MSIPPATSSVVPSPPATPEPSTSTAPPASPPAAQDIAALLAEPDHPAWYKRPLWWGLLVLALVLAVGLWYWQRQRVAHAAPVYTTYTVGRGDLTLTVTANGTLQPTRAINIGSELSGTVLKVNVDVNDRIKRGQVLVELDPSKLRDQVLRAKATLAAAQAKVAQSAATITEAQAGLARLEEVARLSEGKVPSKAELDTGRATLARALASTMPRRRCQQTRSTCPKPRSLRLQMAWCSPAR